MDPLLSEFLGAVARWLLASIGSYFIAHHVLTADQTDRFTGAVLAHLALWLPVGGALVWSLVAKYKDRVKFLTALQAPAGTTEASVNARVENGMGASVKAAGAVLLACVLTGATVTLPACASAPPAGTYTATGMKAFNADQLLKDITALSETAIKLNATTGKLHLKDSDTALIRDFALSAGAGLQSYANGSGTLAVIVSAYHELAVKLSTEAQINEPLRQVLALIAGAVDNIPLQ